MSARFLLLAVALAVAAPISAANALMLSTWNVDELEASDDYVDLQFGTSNGNTTLTLMWRAGADTSDTPGAIGLGKFFINNSDSSLEVTAVYMNSILAANDVSSDWRSNGNTQAGGGFGNFTEKVTESAGDGAIDPDSLIFVLNGLYSLTSFVPNSDGATFAAQIRYGSDCSGWVADGGNAGSSGSDAGCGMAPVPEPSAALVFCAGGLVVASSLRRRR
jgi:hypothetical protein